MLLTDSATSYAPYFQYYAGELQFGINGIAALIVIHGLQMQTLGIMFAACRSGSTCKLFLDGTEVDSDSNSTAFISDGLLFGAWSSRDWNGYMDEIRISTTARYTGAFTPSTTAFEDDVDTALLLHMDGGGGIDPATNLPTLPGQGTYFWDASTNAIFYNAGVSTNKSIISFDGNGDYLSVPSTTDFNFGTGDFTVECWMWATNTQVNGVHVYALDMRDGSSRISLAFNKTSGQGFWGGDGWSMTADWWPALGVWNHIAMVRQSNTGRVI